MALKFLDGTGLSYVSAKIKAMLSGKADTDLSNVSEDALGNLGAASTTELEEVKSTAEEAKAMAENAGDAVVYNATIGTTWTENEDTGVKSQTVAIDGVTADHTGKVDVAYTGDGSSDSYATFVEQQNQYFEFITNGYAETVDGGITFYIFGEPNTVNIPIIAEVV